MEAVVRTGFGCIRGLEDNGIFQFHSIPYAEPPVSELRFGPPVPKRFWEGTLDATCYRAIPPQTANPRPILPSGEDRQSPPESEDCLHLHLFTPGLDRNKRAVLVNFHGGANLGGSAANPVYNGCHLARHHDIVTVNVEFRTGFLGHAYHPNLQTENRAAQDQLCALGWVRDNIHLFGGDPGRVTAIGHSSGANNVMELLLQDGIETLVRGAVLQSGSIGRGCYPAGYASKLTAGILSLVGIDAGDPALRERLHAVSARELCQATTKYTKDCLLPDQWGMVFRPVHDSLAEWEPATRAAGRAAAAKGITLLLGFASQESGIFHPYKSHAVIDLETWSLYAYPNHNLAGACAAAGGTAFLYELSWMPESSPYEASHTLCLPFTYGNLEYNKDNIYLEGATAAEMQRLLHVYGGSIASFVKNGAPCRDEDWLPYAPAAKHCKLFDGETNPVVCGGRATVPRD